MHTEFLGEDLREGNLEGGHDIDGRIILGESSRARLLTMLVVADSYITKLPHVED